MNMIARWNHGNGLIPVTLRGVDDLFRAVLDRMSTDFSPELMFDDGNSPRLELEVGKEAVTASLPIAGCRPEDIDIEVVGDNLTIRATRKMEEPKDENAHYLRRERSYEEYEESVKLPVRVKGGETKAEYVDGVLTVTLPREEEAQPRTHVVKVK